MCDKHDGSRRRPGLKDEPKRRYEPPELQKREKLVEVTGGNQQVIPLIVT